MRSFRGAGLPLFVFLVGFFVAAPALAQDQGTAGQQQGGEQVEPEATAQTQQITTQGIVAPSRELRYDAVFFIGGLAGGDLANIIDGNFSLTGTLENGRTYGGRLGWYRWPLGAEGSFAYSDSGLVAETDLSPDATIRVPARVMYLEANALLLLIPGPVQPFVTGGGGLHSYKIVDLQNLELRKWGWNFGAGLKINIKRVVVRADVRDHLTRFTAQDLGVTDEVKELLGIADQDLHNVEISFGVGFRF